MSQKAQRSEESPAAQSVPDVQLEFMLFLAAALPGVAMTAIALVRPTRSRCLAAYVLLTAAAMLSIMSRIGLVVAVAALVPLAWGRITDERRWPAARAVTGALVAAAVGLFSLRDLSPTYGLILVALTLAHAAVAWWPIDVEHRPPLAAKV